MASLPPKPDAAEAARLSTASNAGKAASTVNKYAKRDPALYPLINIVGGIFATAGYMLTSKSGNDPAKAFTRDVVNPWDESAKHDVHPSQVAAFKYRYRNRDTGALEDSMPTLNSEIKNLTGSNSAKWKTT